MPPEAALLSLKMWEANSVGRPEFDPDGRRSETASHIQSIFMGSGTVVCACCSYRETAAAPTDTGAEFGFE